MKWLLVFRTLCGCESYLMMESAQRPPGRYSKPMIIRSEKAKENLKNGIPDLELFTTMRYRTFDMQRYAGHQYDKTSITVFYEEVLEDGT